MGLNRNTYGILCQLNRNLRRHTPRHQGGASSKKGTQPHVSPSFVQALALLTRVAFLPCSPREKVPRSGGCGTFPGERSDDPHPAFGHLLPGGRRGTGHVLVDNAGLSNSSTDFGG